MKKVTRNILFGAILLIFFVVAPILIFYARGFSIDTDNGEVIRTGIIYVDSNVDRGSISIDDEAPKSENNPFLAKGVLPGHHHLEITAEGFQTWSAEVPVVAEKVTRIENLLLLLQEPILERPIKGELGAYAVSSNGKYTIFTVLDDKDKGLWLHTTDEENNRQLLADDEIEFQDFETITWSDNSKIVLLKNTSDDYYLLSPHVSSPVLLELPALSKIKADDIFFDQDEPTTLFYIKNNELFEWKTTPITNKPERIARNVIDVAVRNPKVFILQSGELNDRLASIDLRLDTNNLAEIITLPSAKSGKKLFVSNGRHVAVITDDSDLLLLERDKGNFTWAEIESTGIDLAAWSPDSRYLMYLKEAEIWVYDQEAPEDEPESYILTRLSTMPTDISWHPESGQLLVHTNSAEASLYRLLHVSRFSPQFSDLDLPADISNVSIVGSGEQIYFKEKLKDQDALSILTFTELN